MSPSALATRDRLLDTFDLFEFGVELMAAQLRRKFPGESSAEIEHRLEVWLETRPGAEHGDVAVLDARTR